MAPKNKHKSHHSSISFLGSRETSNVVFDVAWSDLALVVILTSLFILSCLLVGMVASSSIAIQFGVKSLHPHRRSSYRPRQVFRITATELEVEPAEKYTVYTSPRDGTQTLLLEIDSDTSTASGLSTSSSSLRPPPHRDFWQFSYVQPTLCSDQKTVGFDNWNSLRAVIREANRFAAAGFVEWTYYFSQLNETTGPEFFPDEDKVRITICPGSVLKARKNVPLYINAENLIIKCGDTTSAERRQYAGANWHKAEDSCELFASGTHMSFGPYARHVRIIGLDFRQATTSSLIFHQSGADVTLEDCRWLDNTAQSNKVGSVADVNSTSYVHFFRCTVGKRPYEAVPAGFVSALSIRAP